MLSSFCHRIIIVVAYFLLGAGGVETRGFTIQQDQFMLDGKPTRLISSELHYCKSTVYHALSSGLPY